MEPVDSERAFGLAIAFYDLCKLLDVQSQTDADHADEWFCFEKGAKKTGGGDGWADAWKKGYFGWEYKGPNKDLDKAYAQLQRYAIALENPLPALYPTLSSDPSVSVF